MIVESTKHLPHRGPYEVSLCIDFGGIDADSPKRALEIALEATRMAVGLGLATQISYGGIAHVCPAQGAVQGFLIKDHGDRVVYSAGDSED